MEPARPPVSAEIRYPASVQVRWVVVGTLVVIGAYWLAGGVSLVFGSHAAWSAYGVYALAAFGVGALMVAHAPLRPWREPAAVGVLAVAEVAAFSLAGPGLAANWFIARALHPWYVGLGVAIMSGALAAAGGLLVRRTATATARTNLIVLLSALVTSGIIGLIILSSCESAPVLLAGVVAGGFITQAMIVPRRPWACGAGGCALAVFTLAENDLDGIVNELVLATISGLFLLAIGAFGAWLAWRLLRRGDAPSSPDVPPARLG